MHIAHQLLNSLRLSLRRLALTFGHGPLRLLFFKACALGLGHRLLISRELKLVQMAAANLVVGLIPSWVFWHVPLLLPSSLIARLTTRRPAS